MIDNVRYLIVFTPIAAYLVDLLLMWKYPIDRERQEELRRIIDERERSTNEGRDELDQARATQAQRLDEIESRLKDARREAYEVREAC